MGGWAVKPRFYKDFVFKVGGGMGLRWLSRFKLIRRRRISLRRSTPSAAPTMNRRRYARMDGGERGE